MIKLVISDIDGTLFCNEKKLWKIENRIAMSFGAPAVTRKEHRYHWYKPTKDRLAQTYPGICADSFYDRLMESLPGFAEKRQCDAISPQNIKALEAIRKIGKHLALLTSRAGADMGHLLRGEYRLDKWFEGIYHHDNLKHPKPDPKAFDVLLGHFNVRPSEAVYIGDLEIDGIFAKDAGLEFIAVLEEGIKTKEDFKDIGVDFFAPKFTDILNYIK